MDNHFSNAQRAEVLTQALPYIKKFVGKIVVVKYGGNAMINEQLKQQVMEDIVLLWLIGVKVVLVHGGGPEINDTMKKLGKEAHFVNGLRVTDKETMEIVHAERIPTRTTPAITDEPLIWRFFVTPLRSILASMQVDEEECVAHAVMAINTQMKGAYVFSSG